MDAIRLDAVSLAAAPRAHARRAEGAAGAAPDITFRISTDLAVVADEWRQFERVALLTPFQTYEWRAARQRHIGMRNGVVIGRFADGTIAFILPLAIDSRHTFKRLCWLGQDLCDYKAPLLARDFMARVAPENSGHCGGSSKRKMQSEPQTRHDWIEFEKMPETIGGAVNPFTCFALAPNANSAHIMRLGSDWETLYHPKCSSATRRHDRVKRRHMAQFGDISFVTAAAVNEVPFGPHRLA
ncbi:MAG: hypothetical protein WB495_27045 [Xanthobacteraceae bacterium]